VPAARLEFDALRIACPHGANFHLARAIISPPQEKTIEDIVMSQRSPKGIVVSVKAEFFTTQWARDFADHERYRGEITGWKLKRNKEVWIKWEGWSQNRATSLSALDGLDDKGASVEGRLHDYKDGTAAPVYIEPDAEEDEPMADADGGQAAGGGGGGGRRRR
jgi:hypothetical protein